MTSGNASRGRGRGRGPGRILTSEGGEPLRPEGVAEVRLRRRLFLRPLFVPLFLRRLLPHSSFFFQGNEKYRKNVFFLFQNTYWTCFFPPCLLPLSLSGVGCSPSLFDIFGGLADGGWTRIRAALSEQLSGAGEGCLRLPRHSSSFPYAREEEKVLVGRSRRRTTCSSLPPRTRPLTAWPWPRRPP